MKTLNWINRSCLWVVAAGVMGGAMATIASADILAQYDFSGATAATVDDSSDGNANTIAMDFTAVSPAGFSTSTDSVFLRANATPSVGSPALDGALYFGFVVNAVGANQLFLTSLVFDLGGNDVPTGATFNNTVYVQSSVDGFGSGAPVIASRSSSVIGPVQFPAVSFTPMAPIDLTAAKFQGLSTIEFRFFVTDDSDAFSVINRLTNFVLNGTATIIPEPATAALLIGGTLLVLGGKRRRA